MRCTINRFQITIRGLLATTAVMALLIVVASSWSVWGAVIGPNCLLLSLVASLICFFLRRYSIGRAGFQIASSIFALFTLLYLSFGPACWLMAYTDAPSKHPVVTEVFSYVYIPITYNVVSAPEPIRSWSISYLSIWMPPNAQFCDFGQGLGYIVPGSTYTIANW